MRANQRIKILYVEGEKRKNEKLINFNPKRMGRLNTKCGRIYV